MGARRGSESRRRGEAAGPLQAGGLGHPTGSDMAPDAVEPGESGRSDKLPKESFAPELLSKEAEYPRNNPYSRS